MPGAPLEELQPQQTKYSPTIVNVDADDLIAISSNSPPDSEVPPSLPAKAHPAAEEGLFELIPISRAAEDEEARRRRIESALELFQQFEEQERKERAEMAGVMERRKRQREREMEEERLRKEFEQHGYLPVGTLKKLKAEFHQLETTYKMEKSTTVLQMNSRSLRFEQRKKLTRAMRLAFEEIRHKVNPFALTPSETELLSGSQDLLLASYRLMSELQTCFFQQLYSVRWDRSGFSKYLEQIKIVLKELNDRHNLKFRRDLISRRLTPEDLVAVREQDIECEEARADALAKMKEFLRQHELQPTLRTDQEQPVQQGKEEKSETATLAQSDKSEQTHSQPQPKCSRSQKAMAHYQTAKTYLLNSLSSMQARLLKLTYHPHCGPLLSSLEMLQMP